MNGLPSGQFLLALITSVVVVAAVLELLRRRQLREKYAVLWLTVGIGVSVVSLFPQLLGWAARITNIAVPTNLLFFLAMMLLLGVTMHLSWESSRHEDRIRLLAEELAILRGQLEDLRGERDRVRDDTGAV